MSDEIEITPEMIEAGSSEIVSLDVEYWNGPEIAGKVFRSMIEASQKSFKAQQKCSP